MDVTNDRRHDLQSRGIFVSTRRSGNKPPDCSTQDSFSRNESREQLIHELRIRAEKFYERASFEEIIEAELATYEPFLNGLSRYLLLPIPPWFAHENELDNWQNSPRGRTAKQLVDSDLTTN